MTSCEDRDMPNFYVRKDLNHRHFQNNALPSGGIDLEALSEGKTCSAALPDKPREALSRGRRKEHSSPGGAES